MEIEKKDYYDMIDALQSFDGGFHKPIVNKIHPYVSLLEYHIRNITEIMCGNCPEHIRSKCTNYNGCYCLMIANNLIGEQRLLNES